ncbi:myelin expression factor 2-like [Achroia grisella]|uniref:myelin expression factor 2-like n=1 Tax=Achroia grisella TaxID=688607 RepID=UPI0027D253BD|nr:myelin expression factor 2-like [Achroia grisella]
MQSNRSRSRSPIRSQSNNDSTSDDRNSFKKSHYLFIANLPAHWDHIRVKRFISDTCNSNAISQALKYVTILKDFKQKSKGECLLKFSSHNACNMALQQLKGVECEDKKIVVMPDSGELFEQLDNSNKNKKKPEALMDLVIKRTNLPLEIQTPNNPKPADRNQHQGVHETYGLSLNFLQTLGIKLPLQKRIFVRNLPSDIEEDKLRDLFGYAGLIYGVLIVRQNRDTEPKAFAKIEYDHPVEAVQAISMFHGHEYLNKVLHVQMDNNLNGKFNNLPKELKTVGPGLGPNGEPLRSVRNAVEFEPLKQLLIQEITKLQNMKLQEGNLNTMAMNQAIPQDNSLGVINNLMNLQNPMGTLNVNAFNPLNQANWGGLNMISNQGTQNLQMLQGLLQQTIGNDLSSIQTQSVSNTIQNPLTNLSQTQWGSSVTQNQFGNIGQSSFGNMTQNQSDKIDSFTQRNQINNRQRDRISQERGDSYEKNYDKFDIERLSYADSKYSKESDSMYGRTGTPKKSDESDIMSSAMLLFTNLPSSVTTKALSTKMSEVGEVTFAEMTGQNRAIVRFTSTRDAERCIRLFDRSKVDGQIINVKFL